MLTLSNSEGTGGKVKDECEQFIVKEITAKGHILEPGRRYSAEDLGEKENGAGKFSTIVLQKRDWNTIQALTKIAGLVNRGRKSIAYAGTKDRRSISVQLASIYGAEPEKLLSLNIKDITINGAWKSDGVELGSNLGNAFEVTISDVERKETKKVMEELDGRFPNYFDRQRFGARLNNAVVGYHILRNDFESALMNYLTDPTNEINEESREARIRLKNESDFKGALDYFPAYLKNERTVLGYMARHPNYANALRMLPRGISMMFIHAVEALLFNIALEQRIKEKDFKAPLYAKENFYGFPEMEKFTKRKSSFPVVHLVGYETPEDEVDDYQKKVMEELGIKRDDFKIRGMPELSMKGSSRVLLAPVKDFSASVEGDGIKTRFSIPSGCYATVLLNEITKNEGIDLAELAEPIKYYAK